MLFRTSCSETLASAITKEVGRKSKKFDLVHQTVSPRESEREGSGDETK